MSERAQGFALFVLRLAGLYLALGHGLGKVVALASGDTGFVDAVTKLGFPLPVVFAWAAALAEFAGGLLLALGLLTRIAAFFVAFNMAVAAFLQHHVLSQWLAAVGLATVPAETLKGWGRPELAVIYLLVALTLMVSGGGGWSLDARLRGKRR